MISIIIPAKNEQFLERTIQDLLEKAVGEIEIIPVLDGYNPPERNQDPRVKYMLFEMSIGMREAINAGINFSKGEYIMKIDAHCMIKEGFDSQLIKDHQQTWVQIPRRYNLDAEKWCLEQKVVDYEHYIYPLKYNPPSLHGFRSTERAEERKDIMIDDTMTFQGSCYFMTREYWNEMKFLTVDGYGTLPAQEAAYISNTVWTSGGRVVVNKNTWYAHLYKGEKYGRGYRMDRGLQNDCYEYSYNYWVNERKDDFIKLIEKFWPIPGWAKDWKERLWTH